MLPDKIFGLFYMYGLMIALGILACFGVIYYYGKKKNVEEKFIDFIFYNAILSIALGFGSAGLFQATYNYIENPEQGFQFGEGFTFIGGLIGGVACFLIVYALVRKRYKTRLTQVLSMCPCGILIAHAFGRIGCFFAGCCHGKETDSFLGVQFPHLSSPVHATQLYEAAFLFLLFGVCFYLLMKKNFKHNLTVYLIAYGIFRFLIEYLRGDDRGELLPGVSPSQFWSLLMIAAGVGVYFLLRYLEKRNPMALTLPSQAQSTPQVSDTQRLHGTEDAENAVDAVVVAVESEAVNARLHEDGEEKPREKTPIKSEKR